MEGQKGFTLIELLVAISLFVVIISIAVGGFSSALRSQREAIALMNINNNVSLVLEQMAREIRTGSDFTNNTNPSSQLQFKNSNNQIVVYRLNNSGIERSIDNNNFKKITADNILVEYLNFIISGHSQNDNKRPRITILIGVKSTEPRLSGFVTKLQTTISPRILDS